MHFHIVDVYQDKSSSVHRMDARVKVFVAVFLILLIGLTPMGAFATYAGFFVLALVIVVLARLDAFLVIKRSLIALPFAGAAITLLFTVPGEVIGVVPLVGWAISMAGLVRFASIVFKSLVSVQFAVLLMLTTHFTDVLWALSALRVPKILISIIAFMYRYIFVLADEALRLTRAREARSAVIADRQSLLFQAQTTGRLIGALLLRSFARSERVYQAMLARGYTGETRQLEHPSLRFADMLPGIIASVIGMVLLIASLLF